MKNALWLALIGTAALSVAAVATALATASAAPTNTSRDLAQAVVTGLVVDLEGGPVAEAVVRQKTTANATLSAEDGSFTLGGLTGGVTTTITAWQAGYLVGWTEVVPPQDGITVTLKPHYTSDNPYYQWFSSNDPEGPISCVHCMVAHPEWVGNAHGQAGTNPRFFSLYNGTDITGTATVVPGYKLDFPGTAGNCATCHAPAAAVRGLRSFAAADMNDLTEVEAEGVFCEFCHKVGAVYLDPATGLPYGNAPGVLSMRLYRPSTSGEEQLFFGPFDDVTRRVSYLPLEKKSQFCAPCHQLSFWGTPIYESFREWLESPYPALGIECQTCHMAPTHLTDYFVFPDKGGLVRDPSLIASHLQPGASDVELLQNTVTMTVSAQPVVGHVQVTVTITNTGAGHHVPTDFPGRHMILVVSATDGQGASMAQYSGPTVPGWGGAEAGLPGKAFAKVLRDVQTGASPVVTYWKQALIASDNRIPALQSDTSTYTFAPAPGQTITVTAELHFRRAFQHLQDVKGWDAPDILMEREDVVLVAPPRWGIFLPLILKEAD
jgi:hypothetical protein